MFYEGGTEFLIFVPQKSWGMLPQSLAFGYSAAVAHGSR